MGGCEAKLEAGAVIRGQIRRLEFIQTVNGSHGKILSRVHLLPGGGGGGCVPCDGRAGAVSQPFENLDAPQGAEEPPDA